MLGSSCFKIVSVPENKNTKSQQLLAVGSDEYVEYENGVTARFFQVMFVFQWLLEKLVRHASRMWVTEVF